jgi:hypothetical protein
MLLISVEMKLEGIHLQKFNHYSDFKYYENLTTR